MDKETVTSRDILFSLLSYTPNVHPQTGSQEENRQKKTPQVPGKRGQFCALALLSHQTWKPHVFWPNTNCPTFPCHSLVLIFLRGILGDLQLCCLPYLLCWGLVPLPPEVASIALKVGLQAIGAGADTQLQQLPPDFQHLVLLFQEPHLEPGSPRSQPQGTATVGLGLARGTSESIFVLIPNMLR